MLSSSLSLNGIGYLHDVFQENGKTYAKLNIIPSKSEKCDDIWIECIVAEKDAFFMLNLKKKLSMNKTVLLKFEASYTFLGYSYSGQTEEDPNYVLGIKGKLKKISEWYIDGEKNYIPNAC